MKEDDGSSAERK